MRHASQAQFRIPSSIKARKSARTGLALSCLISGWLLVPGTALASTGCDTANAGGYDVTTGIGGISIINFNGDFDAGDTLNFATDANNLAASILNVNSGLTAIAGTGVLNVNFALTATQNYSFTGTLTATLLNTTTLTITCTAAPGGGGGGGGGGGKNTKNITNTLVSALTGRPSLLSGGIAGTQADSFATHCKAIRRRLDHAQENPARQSLWISRMQKEFSDGGACAGHEDRNPAHVSALEPIGGRLTRDKIPGPDTQFPIIGLSRPAPEHNLIVSSAASINSFSSSSPGGLDGDALSHSYSVNKRLSEDVIVGVFTQFRHGDVSLNSQASSLNAHFAGVGTTLVARLTDTFKLRTASLVEWGDGDIEIDGDKGAVDIFSTHIAARLEGALPFGNWTLTPSMGAEYSHASRDDITFDNNSSVGAGDQSSARLVFGPELQRTFLFAKDDELITLHPFITVRGSWEFLDADKVTGPDQTLIKKGEVAMRYGTGFRLVWSDDFAMSAGVEANSLKNASEIALATQLSFPIKNRSGEKVGHLQLNASGAPDGEYYAGFQSTLPLN